MADGGKQGQGPLGVPGVVWLLVVLVLIGSFAASVKLKPHAPELLTSDSGEIPFARRFDSP